MPRRRRATIRGERISIIGASQVIDDAQWAARRSCTGLTP
jgi:hypothetical protein